MARRKTKQGPPWTTGQLLARSAELSRVNVELTKAGAPGAGARPHARIASYALYTKSVETVADMLRGKAQETETWCYQATSMRNRVVELQEDVRVRENAISSLLDEIASLRETVAHYELGVKGKEKVEAGFDAARKFAKRHGLNGSTVHDLDRYRDGVLVTEPIPPRK